MPQTNAILAHTPHVQLEKAKHQVINESDTHWIVSLFLHHLSEEPELRVLDL